MGDRSVECAVVGGGVAGLAAAIRLAELGKEVVLIEAGSYPAHKVCGEFLSPEALPLLAKWGLAPPIQIEQARFFPKGKPFHFRFPRPAGSWCRYELDRTLANKAEELGATILTNTRVEAIDDRTLTLSTGETLRCQELLLGTGRLTSSKPEMVYWGFKAHFEGIELDTLDMHLSPGCYLGMSPIGNGRVNIAGLSTTPERTLPPILGDATPLFDWMEVRVPQFGPKRPTLKPHLYHIGDAAGVIAPATGDGLAMALTSGILAANHAAQSQWELFPKAWQSRFGRRLRWAKLLHFALLHPLPLWRPLARPLFSLTRSKSVI